MGFAQLEADASRHAVDIRRRIGDCFWGDEPGEDELVPVVNVEPDIVVLDPEHNVGCERIFETRADGPTVLPVARLRGRLTRAGDVEGRLDDKGTEWPAYRLTTKPYTAPILFD